MVQITTGYCTKNLHCLLTTEFHLTLTCGNQHWLFYILFSDTFSILLFSTLCVCVCSSCASLSGKYIPSNRLTISQDQGWRTKSWSKILLTLQNYSQNIFPGKEELLLKQNQLKRNKSSFPKASAPYISKWSREFAFKTFVIWLATE